MVQPNRAERLVVLVAASAGTILCTLLGFLWPDGVIHASDSQVKPITIEGSTTVEPIARAFADHYMAAYPGVRITVAGSGSGKGAQCLINKACDIACMSRFMEPGEFNNATAKGIHPVFHTIAVDAISVVVHPDNPVEELSLEDVRAIFSGAITNWKDVGGPDAEILVTARRLTDGTGQVFSNTVMEGDRVKAATCAETSAEVQAHVSAARDAIGYVGLAYLAGVKPVALDGILPSVEAVASGQYPICRPLFMVTDGYPELGSPVYRIVTMQEMAHGRAILSKLGFVPLSGYREVTMREVIQHYWDPLLAIALALVVCGVSAVVAVRLNRSLRTALAGKKREILERTEMQQALRESERRFKGIFDNATDGILLARIADRRLEDGNETICRMLGYSVEELRTLGVSDIHPAEHLPYVLGQFEKQTRGEIQVAENMPVKRKDGTIFYADINSAPLVLGGEEYLMGSFRDITERRRVEEERREALTRQEALLENIPAMIFLKDADGRYVAANRAYRDILPASISSPTGKRDNDMFPPKLAARFAEEDRQVLEEERVVTKEQRMKLRDGRMIPVSVSLSPVRGPDGRITGLVGIAFDITERKMMESQLAQAQKLESIGQLAAGIAHEINTPTQYVGDNVRFLQDGFEDLMQIVEKHGELLCAARNGGASAELIDNVEALTEEADLEYLRDEIPNAIGQSLEGIDRVGEIVRAMKQFSHPGGEEKTRLDLNNAIETTITVARNEWKYVAEMETDFDEAVSGVPCYPGDLNQVILNIIVNAAHAISDVVGGNSGQKGTITVKTRRDGNWAEIRISDTGGGIPQEIRSRIFDPFFTTKEVGKGTGQGLAIAHNIITEKHGGSLTFESDVGNGTTFVIRLPAGESSKAAAPQT